MTINIFDPAFTDDPYPILAEARARGPIEHDPIEGWWVLDPDLVSEVLRDPQFVKDPTHAQDGLTKTMIEERGHFSLLYMDNPDHGRIRGLVSKVFHKRSVEALADRIQQVTDELLDAVASTGEFDLMEALAVPLPIIVIAEILGIDPADRADFSRWSRDGALAFNPFLAPDVAEGAAFGRGAARVPHDNGRGAAARSTRRSDHPVGRSA